LINDVIKRNCRLQVTIATLAIPQRRNARPLQWKLTRNHDILDSCEGLFVDMEGSWQPMWPPALDSTTYLPQKVSLDNLLHQDAMGRSRRLRLAVQIANTMMYLHGTDWLGNTWGKCDIFFRSRPVGKLFSIVNFRQPDLDKPFFYRRPHSVRNIQGAAGMNSPLQINKTLFSLGIILIELWFGKRLEDFPDNLQFPAGIERTNNTEYLIEIAQHLLGTVGNDARLLYGDVVRRCILGLDLSRPALENQDYKREVYTEVVSELERSWKTFVGRDERVGETKAAGVD